MMQPRADPVGLFDVHYRAFLETLTHVRADLHRYCTRMTGSVFDGEDVMQETLFEAYRKIEALDDPSALRPWLFRIAHNRCIDFLRKQTHANGRSRVLLRTKRSHRLWRLGAPMPSAPWNDL